MGITTKELARICGTSRTTVERALNGKKDINSETKQRILAIAKKHGYHPDMVARSLVKGSSMCIGVIVFDIRNYYFAQLVSSIEQEAKNNGYTVNITMQEKEIEREIDLINALVSRRIDGLILCPVNKGPDFEQFLSSLPIPTVVVSNDVGPSIHLVGIDERTAAKEATDFLIAKGYKKIIFVCPPLNEEVKENVYTHAERTGGVKESVAIHPSCSLELITSWNYSDEILSLVETTTQKTVFFFSGDVYAMEMLNTLKRRGINIPGHIGIMGFDDTDMLKYIQPSIATVDTAIDLVGKTSFDVLLNLIERKDVPVRTIVDHHIVDGESI